MKVTIINHSDSRGGAAVASFRLLQALNRAGVQARMLVKHKSSSDPAVAMAHGPKAYMAPFLWERLKIFMHNGFSREQLFKVSVANAGLPIDKHSWVQEADILLLGWINQGMLSFSGIRALGRLGKPIVWNMHDMWCLTGACHHALECPGYKESCGNCPFLHNGSSSKDLSRRTWEKKKRLYASIPLHFTTVSNWLADKCRESSLLGDADVTVIPNAFPVESFPMGEDSALPPLGIDPSKKLILMGAARLDDPIKGLGYAVEAFNLFFDNYPSLAKDCLAVFFGEIREGAPLQGLRMPYVHTGAISDQRLLRDLYACAKAVVSTSLYETLQLTLIEGQAAGCVPVSFGEGGQTDIIRHKATGWLAPYKSPRGIAEGIAWALTDPPSRQSLREWVQERFSSETVAGRYIDLFNRLLAEKTL